MAKNLVIVESPSKAKTIERYLGPDFIVASSMGHIADLPSKELGVDVERGFQPKYLISKEKKEIVARLKKIAKGVDTVWLASDEDREGEAIAWHLAQQLDLDDKKIKRIVFHEITKKAILNAIDKPRKIDNNLVDAQQARRVLDRLVGYELSPVLWRKVKGGLSAGRVQSVAVRLIVEREREIQEFNSESAFKVSAEFHTSEGKLIKSSLLRELSSKKDAYDFLAKSKGATFQIGDVLTKPARKSPAPPFTTSTLQQEASRKLYFPVSKTMRLAQSLYEEGHITYMRTDSLNLSQEALQAAKKQILSEFGDRYSSPRQFTTKTKGAQEAHEAIRPTNMAASNIPAERDAARLYELIWKRTLASQMSDAELERTQVDIHSNHYEDYFRASGEVILFDGFLKLYLEGSDDEEEEKEGLLPLLSKGDSLMFNKMLATQKFSRPPYRYTEASLVKRLEELGIGRPSTYAPTISTIQQRGYIEKGKSEGKERFYVQLSIENENITEHNLKESFGSDKGKLIPTDVGMIVSDFLTEHFGNIVDYHFTAEMENDFDDVAMGKRDWTGLMKSFYGDFHPQVEKVMETAAREKGERILGVDPATGREVSVKLGKFGPMVQLGTAEDKDKPLFASLPPSAALATIGLDQALALFSLPKKLGEYKGEIMEVNVGKFGPYVKYMGDYISLPKDTDPLSVTESLAIELIEKKRQAELPIARYQDKDVTKGKGRFGPYIKWDGLFINVGAKYDFDKLSQTNIADLIEDKIKKEREKIVHKWESDGITVEKGKWGRFYIIKGTKKIEVPKGLDPKSLTLEGAKTMLEGTASKKKKTK